MLGWVTGLSKLGLVVRLDMFDWINMLNRLGWVTKLLEIHSYLHFGPIYIYLIPTYLPL
jgi:hypothetical protein